MKTIICLVLDRSGSMGGRERDVVGGVNAFIDEQKKLPDPAAMAFVRFDTEGVERFRDMQPLDKVAHLQPGDFVPRGGTPLLDAVGKTIHALDGDWKREAADRAIVIIVTDGEENSSREFTKDKVKALIKARQDSGLWAFVYLGANVDAFHEAAGLGIMGANTAGYTNTAAGNKTIFAAASASTTYMRSTGSNVSPNLGKNIGEHDEDGKAPVPPLPAQAPEVIWTPGTGDSSGVWTPPV